MKEVNGRAVEICALSCSVRTENHENGAYAVYVRSKYPKINRPDARELPSSIMS